MENRVLLVDGMALLFRHFYATSLHNQFMYNSKDIYQLTEFKVSLDISSQQ